MKIHKLSAYGLGAFVLTFGATLAFGQARVPYTRPPYIVTPGDITASGNLTANTARLTTGSGDALFINSGRPICFDATTCPAGSRIFYNGSNMQAGGGFVAGALITTSSVNSSTASGNQAFTCTNTGCRLSLGNTARYFYDTGSDIGLTGANLYLGSESQLIYVAKIQEPNSNATLTLLGGKNTSAADSVGVTLQTRTQSVAGAKIASFQNGTSEVSFIDYLGNMSANSYTAAATSGNSFTGGNSSNVMTLTSNTTDTVTSSTVPAIRLQASQDVTNTDLLMSVEDSAGNRRMTVTEAGVAVFAGAVTAGGQFTSTSQYESATGTFTSNLGSSISTTLQSGRTSGSAIQLKVTSNMSADTDRTVAIQNNVTTEVAHFSKDGLLRVNANNAAKPTCNSDNRGRLYYLNGAAGVADVMEVCMKSAADVYAWAAVATP